MHRSIVIPKGTISPDKTTIVRIPITTPANTSPLIVVNRQSPTYNPSDTQEFKNANLSKFPAIPNKPPDMYESQARNQSQYVNQTKQESCDCNTTPKGNTINTNPVQNPLQNTLNLVAYCTDKPPDTNNISECECQVDNYDMPDPDCTCDIYAPCKSTADEWKDQYLPNTTTNGPPNASYINGTSNVTNVRRSSSLSSNNGDCFCSSYAPCQASSNQQETYEYVACPSNDLPDSTFDQGPTTFDRGQPVNGNYTIDEGSDCFCSAQAPCHVSDNQYTGFTNNFQAYGSLEDDDEPDCLCSPQAVCKNDQDQQDFLYSTQANSAFGYPDQTFTNDNSEQDCLCSPQSPCKAADDFPGSPQANSTFASPERPFPDEMYTAEQSFGQICDCGDRSSSRIQDEIDTQYITCPLTSTQENEVSTGTGCPNYSPCPLDTQENPGYLDSINEEEEDEGPNPNMKIINVTSRTYTRINRGPVQGRTFTFDDPEKRGVSSMVFDQLAKSILEEPPDDYQQDSFITTCTDKLQRR